MTPDAEAAIDRIAARLKDRSASDGRSYLFLAMSILAMHSPETVEFLLDRSDERVTHE